MGSDWEGAQGDNDLLVIIDFLTRVSLSVCVHFVIIHPFVHL